VKRQTGLELDRIHGHDDAPVGDGGDIFGLRGRKSCDAKLRFSANQESS
jgi:hypothetical protein